MVHLGLLVRFEMQHDLVIIHGQIPSQQWEHVRSFRILHICVNMFFSLKGIQWDIAANTKTLIRESSYNGKWNCLGNILKKIIMFGMLLKLVSWWLLFFSLIKRVVLVWFPRNCFNFILKAIMNSWIMKSVSVKCHLITDLRNYCFWFDEEDCYLPFLIFIWEDKRSCLNPFRYQHECYLKHWINDVKVLSLSWQEILRS